MIGKKSIQALLLGITLLVFLWLGVGQNRIIAATLTGVRSIPQEMIQIRSEVTHDLESGIDRFVTAIPSGYYAITNATGLKSLLENPQTVLVDVREPFEYRSGHIPHAINIPLRTLTHNLDIIPGDRPVVLYCSTGYRSAMGVMTLHLLGYENVKGFPPGFAGWESVGETIAK